MVNLSQARARARAFLWTWGGKFLWSCVCAAEVLVSTALHCAFAAFIMHCAITKDVLALLPDLLNPFSSPPPLSSQPNPISSSSATDTQPASPHTPPASQSSFWPSSPYPSYSYLMSCSVLFSSPSTHPFRLADWLKRSASALSSSLSWSPSFSSRSFREPRRFQDGASRESSRQGTSLLQLDVPGAGAWRRWTGSGTEPELDAACCGCSLSEASAGPSQGVGEGELNLKEVAQLREGGAVAPIVLLHGIFGFGHGKLGKLSYFGGVERQHEAVYVPDLGSLTSVHDRARRLFYYLKGGVIDYGEEHSVACGHARFGDSLPGQHRIWDENNPVHLVGHSAGVQVARLLQQMLADKEFDGYDTSADWVASITSLSGALNGTTRVYIDGLSVDDGETMTPISLLQVLRFGVLTYEWLDLPWFRDYYSFGFEHFGISWRKTGFKGIWSTLMRNSWGPFKSGDWILPDLSPQRSLRLNRDRIRTHPNTYYFSYATVATQQLRLFGHRFVVPAGPSTVHPLFTLRCLQMSLWRFPSSAHLPYPGFRDEEWQHNDGALNVISMLYPMAPEKLGGEQSEGEEEPECQVQRQRQRMRREARLLARREHLRVLHPHKPMPVVTTSASPLLPSMSSPHIHTNSGSTDICTLPSCHKPSLPGHLETQPFSPGVWYYSLLEADHILFIISPRRAGVHFDILYRSIFSRCRSMRGSRRRGGVSMSAKGGLSHVSEIEQVLEEVGEKTVRQATKLADSAGSSSSSGSASPGGTVGDRTRDDFGTSTSLASSGIQLCGSGSSSCSSFSTTGSDTEGLNRESASDSPGEDCTDADMGEGDEQEEGPWIDVVERHPSWSDADETDENTERWHRLDAADLAWPKVMLSEPVAFKLQEALPMVRKIQSDVGSGIGGKESLDKRARRRRRAQQRFASTMYTDS